MKRLPMPFMPRKEHDRGHSGERRSGADSKDALRVERFLQLRGSNRVADSSAFAARLRWLALRRPLRRDSLRLLEYSLNEDGSLACQP